MPFLPLSPRACGTACASCMPYSSSSLSFGLLPIRGRHSGIIFRITDSAGLLRSDAFPATNLPKEVNARLKLITNSFLLHNINNTIAMFVD